MTSLSRSWHRWAATASVACVARLVAVADWWRGWPKVINCSCQWFTFWTYLITVNLFSLYLINFMFHTTLDTVGNILTVNYKSMKYDVNSLSQGSVSTLFRWGEDIIRDFRVCVKSVLPAYSSAKIIRNQTSFSRVMTTNVLSRFCESQCIYIFGGSCPLTEYCHVQNSLCVQVLPSILAALLRGTPAAGVSQTAAWYKKWDYGTFADGATYVWLGGHQVGHRPTF